MGSETVRLLNLIVANVTSIVLQDVGFHRIDLHDDDSIEVHFLPRRVPLLGECLAASSLMKLHESEIVAELQVPELTRK